MRKIFVLAAIIFVMLSTQSGYMANVDSAQTNIYAENDSTCDWPMFGRTPDGNRVVPNGCILDFDKPKLIWSNEEIGTIFSSPIYANKRVYVGCRNNSIYCLEEGTGKIVWEYQSDDSFYSTPAYSNDRICIGSTDGKLYCLDANNGKKLWEKSIGECFVSANINNNKVYIGSSSSMFYCFDLNSGNEIWSINTIEDVEEYPVIQDNKVYFGTFNNSFQCLNADNGDKIWTFSTGSVIASSAVINNDYVYFTTKGEDYLYCLNKDNGSLVWKIKTDKPFETTPVFAFNNLYLGGWTNKFICVNASNGKLIWEFKVRDIIDSSCAISNNNIFFGSRDGNIYCIDAINGLQKWKYQTKKMVCSSPIIANNKLIIGSYDDQKIYCFGLELKNPSKLNIICEKKLDTCSSTKLDVTVLDQNDQEIENAPIQWSVDPPESGTIDSSGLFTPKKTGKVKITCKSGNLTESITINVIEFLTVNSEGVRIDVVKPKQVASKTIAYTNNSDRKLTVDVVSNLGLVTVSPSSFVIEPGKSQEVSVSAQLASFEPVPDTEFVITASYDTCTKQLKGLLSSSLPFACLAASPDSLAFGMVERGYAKTMSLSILSEVETKISVSTSEAWISVPVKEMTLKAGVPAIISFKIHASSLPSASRLSGNVIIKSDVAFCDTLTIPVTVETEESITIKLKIDSKSATINNQKRDLDAPPKIMGGRTMVPLRFISEAFGCNIEWDAKEQRIGIVRYDISVNLWIGKDYVEVNGQKLKIDSPPIIVAGRTMVPLRFIAEPFGAKVEWNAQTKEITIVWPKP
ncbi:MAG: PQQ-binding-like beta-propeller repeat protein [Caldisericia bacterium]|nr:PQQ-binding-like beta-propeller repeat protein [Caldisericia bacterium]